MYLSYGMEINVYDISSLIIEREGAESAMLESLVGGSSPPDVLRCPCFLTWSSRESNLHSAVLCL